MNKRLRELAKDEKFITIHTRRFGRVVTHETNQGVCVVMEDVNHRTMSLHYLHPSVIVEAE